MTRYWKTMRNAAAAALFVGCMGFGAMQAMAEDGEDREASCSAWACAQECAPFGGQLGPGGPGQPLQCYCCG